MSCRNRAGSVLVLMTVMIAFIIVGFVIFLINFVRFTGSYNEQRSAIESAALAAAKDLSRIVVEDQYFGFISLADAAPKGRATTAGDNYFMPVTGINTLLATVRIDMIIADLFGDETMKACAKLDYDRSMAARQRLVDALQAAIQPGASGADIDGNKVSPVDDAIAAYNSNQIRMSGRGNTLIPGSLKITLGCVPGLTTNTRIPSPDKYANLSPNQQDNGYYKSFINVPYKNKDFVFAATADNVTLVDFRKFQTTISGLPYLIPSIVKCEADEQFVGNQTGTTSKRIVHAAACSQPASLIDQRPAPGALVLSFPDGAVKGITTLNDVFSNTLLNKSPTDYAQSPVSGDFPSSALSDITLPEIGNEHAPYGQYLRVALYDWIRRGGHTVNIDSLQNAFLQALDSSSSAHADYFSIKGGTITHSVASCPGLLPVSNNQWIAVTGLTITYLQGNNNYLSFDGFSRNFVYQPGRVNGGIHGGEPLGAVLPPKKPKGAIPQNTIGIDPLQVGSFQIGPSGGAIRPTYQTDGIAVEIRFSRRM